MARIPYVDPATAPPRLREALDRLPAPLNVFRMVANAAGAFPDWARLGGAILGKMDLAPRLRELVILRVARLSGCAYEWGQHVPIGLACGLDEAAIAALERDATDDPAFDERDRAVLRAVDEAIASVRLGDAALDGLRAHFDARGIVEILLTVGFYRGLAMLLESTGVDLDPPAGEALVGDIRRRLAERGRG